MRTSSAPTSAVVNLSAVDTTVLTSPAPASTAVNLGTMNAVTGVTSSATMSVDVNLGTMDTAVPISSTTVAAENATNTYLTSGPYTNIQSILDGYPPFTDAEAFAKSMQEFVHPILMHVQDAELIEVMKTQVSRNLHMCGNYGEVVLKLILASTRVATKCHSVPAVEPVRMLTYADMQTHRPTEQYELMQRIHHLAKFQYKCRT